MKADFSLDRSPGYDSIAHMADTVPRGGTGNELTSIRKALRLLKSFVDGKGIATVSDLAAAHRMPKSSVSRILRELSVEGFVAKNSERGDYRLGSELFRLGNVALHAMSIRQVAMAHMAKCAEKYGETVHLAILNESKDIISLEATPSSYNLRPDVHVGGRVQYHCTSVGKAIFAFLCDDDRRKILRSRRIKYTQNTIVDEKKLTKELRKIRAQGYAVDDMENENGVKCVGAPIFDKDDKVVAAISISGASVRFSEEKIRSYAAAVMEAARNISYELGSNKGTPNNI